jgi:hypothetical protein
VISVRIVIHLANYDDSPAAIEHEVHSVRNPESAGDDRAVIDGIDVEWYPGGGNVHVVDARIEQVAEMVDGRVLIARADGTERSVPDASLSTVYPDG